MVFIDSHIFNQVVFLQYNSTVGKFGGYTELGIKNAKRLNNDSSAVQGEKSNLENFCKYNAKLYYPGVYDKSGEIMIQKNILYKYNTFISTHNIYTTF